MLHLRAYNSKTFVDIKDKDKYKFINQKIKDILSYESPTAVYSGKYITGGWDGKISLYDGRNKSFPAGLTDYLIEKLTEEKIQFTWSDERELPKINANYSANYGDRKLRDYQIDAAKIFKKATRGLLSMATGSGKTLSICNLICELQCKPIMIIVPSISLLRQTADEIESVLNEKGNPIKIGRIGGGNFDVQPNGINISTYQSALNAYNLKLLEGANKLIENEEPSRSKTIAQLKNDLEIAKKKKNAAKLISKIEKQISDRETSVDNKIKLQKALEECQTFIVDECHLASVVIEFLSSKADKAYYKCGFSATCWREDNQEIRIEGALGRILMNVTSSELIERGFLCKPTIMMFKIKEETECTGYQECYIENVIFSEYRNNLIAQIAEHTSNNKLPTVILVERLDHGKILNELIQNSVFVPGKEKGDDDPDDQERDYRKRMLDKMSRNECVLIATQWIYTGVDCPPMQSLILAGSSSSSITTYQQVGRVLRLSPKTNKKYALVIDFLDSNKYLKKHGAKRKQTYKKEKEFEIKIIG